MKIDLRKKPLSALKCNVRELPYHLAIWKNKGDTANYQRGERILRECEKEIARRDALSAVR